jgi:hypothetical protein
MKYKSGYLTGTFFPAAVGIASVAAAVAVMGVSLIGLSDEEGAKRVLDNEGYTNVQMTGTNSFSCGGGDLYRTGFKATNLNKKSVEGTVCSGIFKGNTIRLD